MEIFSVVCENVSVTAVQDILSVTSASTRKLQLLGVEIGVTGQTTVGNYPIRIRYLPSSVTPGSGGSSVTPHNINPDGAAVLATARRNDPTQATSGGTAVTFVATMLNPIAGYVWTPPVGIGDEPKADLSSAFVLSLDGVAGTLGLSATMWLREV